MSKRNCTFNDNLQKEYSFLKKSAVSPHHVFCSVCSNDFSIATGGKSHIASHLKSERHKNAAKTLSNMNSLTSFLRCGLSDKSILLATAEGTFAYHNVMHNNSFRLMDCTTKVMKKVYNSAFSCARSKCEAIIENVFAKYAIEELKSELNNASYVSLYSDASNHGCLKLFPILVRYFNPEKGICVKLLEFQNKPGETSEIISSYVMDTINLYELNSKVIAFCADNTNTNFSGYARKGTNNVYNKLQAELGRNIIGIGCSAHILNNTIHIAADNLPVDIEAVLVKIYSHFHVYTIRVEALKDYCNYVNTEYSQVLGYSKTRWLALLPAITRLIQMFSPLKAYFLSLPKCPMILKSFFENKYSEMWLCFVEKQAFLFHLAIEEGEGQNVTVIEVSATLMTLVQELENRLSEKFVPVNINKMLHDSAERNEMLEKIFSFYDTAVEYLKKWIVPFKDYIPFLWMNFRDVPRWENIQGCQDFFSQVANVIDDGALFDEFSFMKSFVDNSKISAWNNQNTPIEDRWIEIFEHFKKTGVACENLLNVAELILCLPASNAPTERVFSVVNNIWTSEKNSMHVSTLKSILTVKTNLTYSCIEFYGKLVKDKNMLLAIHSSEKYNT